VQAFDQFMSEPSHPKPGQPQSWGGVKPIARFFHEQQTGVPHHDRHDTRFATNCTLAVR
jgi:hypothetical protein